MMFDLPALSGEQYVVQYTDDLGAKNWVPLQSLAGRSGVVTITNTAAGVCRFYRAVAFPDGADGTLFFVSPDGQDTNSGNRACSPFASITRAQSAVRAQIAQGIESDITVWLRAGRYELKEPLIFGPADSGTKSCAIRYAAFPGEKVVVSGGRQITGWQPGTNSGGRFKFPKSRLGSGISGSYSSMTGEPPEPGIPAAQTLSRICA